MRESLLVPLVLKDVAHDISCVTICQVNTKSGPLAAAKQTQKRPQYTSIASALPTATRGILDCFSAESMHSVERAFSRTRWLCRATLGKTSRIQPPRLLSVTGARVSQALTKSGGWHISFVTMFIDAEQEVAISPFLYSPSRTIHSCAVNRFAYLTRKSDMNVPSRATNGVATRAEGSLAHCGSGSGDFELSYSCQGPSCSSLDGSLQNVVCHKDGSSILICSTDTKCQPGTSSYQSNFTFSQNEPDPWSPTMENKPDVWVPQNQHVMVGGCAKFSLTSDGTKKGTHIIDAENTCPNVQRLSTLNALAGHVPTSTGRSHVGATESPTVFTGKSARLRVSRCSLLLTLVFAIVVFFPGAQGSASRHRPNIFHHSSGAHIRAIPNEPRDLADGLANDLTVKANSQGYNGHAFAVDLVDGVISSVCQGGLEGSGPKPFDPEVLNSCIASVYGDDQVPAPALRFLAVFGGSILCNYIVSETWPNGQDFSPSTCDGLQDLLNALRKDASMSNDPASAAAGSTTRNAGSPGVFFPIASTPDAQNLDQATPASLESGLIAPLTASPEVLAADTAAIYAPPSLSALLPSGLSTFSAPTDNMFAVTLSPDEFGPASLFGPVPSGLLTATASLAQASGLPMPPSLGSMPMEEATSRPRSMPSIQPSDTFVTSPGPVGLPEPTSLVGTAATPSTSHAARPPNSANLNSPSAGSISTGPSLNVPSPNFSLSKVARLSNEAAEIGSSTSSPSTADMLAAPDQSSESKQITSAQPAASALSPKSSLLSQNQALTTDPSIPGLDGVIVSSEPVRPLSSQMNHNNFLENENTDTRTQNDLSRSALLSLKQPSSVSPYVTAIPLTAVDSQAALKQSIGSPHGSFAQAPVSDSSTKKNVPGYSQRLSAEPSMKAAGNSTDVLAVARSSSTGSVTILLTPEYQSSTPFSPYKVTPTPVALTKPKLPDSVPAYYSLSGTSISLSPTGRASNTLAVDGSSFALSSPDLLPNTNVDNAASAVAASVVSFLTASTAAASLASVAASIPNLASVLPSSHMRFTAAVELTGLSTESVDGESKLRSESSPFFHSSATILPDLSRTAMMSTASASSGSEEKSRPLFPSAELSFNASARPMSISRSSGAKVTSIQRELTTPLTSVTSTMSPGSLTPVSSPSSTAVSHLASKLSQALVPEPSPANVSIPFGIFGPGNSVYSSNESLVPANVPPTSLPQATTVVTSSSGSSTPVASNSAPADGSLTKTPSGAKVNLTSDASHTTLHTMRSSNLATLCAQNSSAPSFCPGIGCVNLMTNKAHCGACEQACMHVCYQGACVCPDLTSPDEKHKCESKPVHVECENGYYTRNGNGFRVCAPAVWSSISSTSTPTLNRSSIIRSTAPSISSSLPSGSPLLLAIATSVETVETEPTGCPPILPDLCNGICFNTMSEHNHCGSCGKFCSGTCVAGICFVMSAKASPQLASTGRMVTTSDLPTRTPARQTSTATVQPVVAYIWRGLGGV
jgi:hypothetical protein